MVGEKWRVKVCLENVKKKISLVLTAFLRWVHRYHANIYGPRPKLQKERSKGAATLKKSPPILVHPFLSIVNKTCFIYTKFWYDTDYDTNPVSQLRPEKLWWALQLGLPSPWHGGPQACLGEHQQVSDSRRDLLRVVLSQNNCKHCLDIVDSTFILTNLFCFSSYDHLCWKKIDI